MLAVWTPDAIPMPSIWGASTLERKRFGMRPGERAAGVFGFADRRPRPLKGYPPGECEDGVIIDRHPEAMLRDNIDLIWIVNLWRSRIARDLPYTLLEQMTAFEIEAWDTMCGAYYRARARGGKPA